MADARKVTLRSEAERLAREVARVDEALQRLVVQRAESPQLPASVFDAALTEMGERRAGLLGALEEAQRAERAAVSDPVAVARGLLEDWWTAPVEHRRELLRSLVDRVTVVTGRPRATVRVLSTWDRS